MVKTRSNEWREAAIDKFGTRVGGWVGEPTSWCATVVYPYKKPAVCTCGEPDVCGVGEANTYPPPLYKG